MGEGAVGPRPPTSTAGNALGGDAIANLSPQQVADNYRQVSSTGTPEQRAQLGSDLKTWGDAPQNQGKVADLNRLLGNTDPAQINSLPKVPDQPPESPSGGLRARQALQGSVANTKDGFDRSIANTRQNFETFGSKVKNSVENTKNAVDQSNANIRQNVNNSNQNIKNAFQNFGNNVRDFFTGHH